MSNIGISEDAPPSVIKAQVIKAPSQESVQHVRSIFLAGTTTGSVDWRDTLLASLMDLPITIYNPLRRDWDSSWREEMDCKPYREQVEWELEKQEDADLVLVYFGAGTLAPISLLELGLCARDRRAVVCCEEGYKKKGNVQIVCARYEVDMVDNIAGFRDVIVKLLALNSRRSTFG